MKYLLDTQAFVWGLSGHRKLSRRARRILGTPSNEFFISSILGWELVVNVKKGKIKLPGRVFDVVSEQVRAGRVTVLPVELEDAIMAAELPDLHNDPLDRLLIAQSKRHDIPLVTSDGTIPLYNVKTVW